MYEFELHKRHGSLKYIYHLLKIYLSSVRLSIYTDGLFE